MLFKSMILALAAVELVAGHAAMVKVVGDMGGEGMAIGGKCLIFSLPATVEIDLKKSSD